MMDKIDVVKKIQEVGVCAVIRGKDAEEAMAMSDACIAGGVTIIELAFTTPQAHEVIAALSKKYADNPDVVIGMPITPTSSSAPAPSSTPSRPASPS